MSKRDIDDLKRNNRIHDIDVLEKLQHFYADDIPQDIWTNIDTDEAALVAHIIELVKDDLGI